MTFKKFIASVVSFTVSLLAFGSLAVMPAFAVSVGLNGSTNVGVGGTGANASVGASASATANAGAREQKVITRSDTEIDARITALNNLSARIEGLKNVSSTVKTNIAAEVESNHTGLTFLKGKIDGESDATTLLSDEKTITANYRIYALVIPQGYITAAADRVTTIVSMFTTVSGKLQIRINSAQSVGKDVTSLNSTLADMNVKIADANVQATSAISATANLTPDQGNSTVAASNKTALVSARADLKTATADLKTARQDAGTIIKALAAFHLEGSASTTSASTQ
jgi:hypothetical protein